MTYQEIKGWFTEDDQRVYQELLNQIPDKGTMVELGVCQGRSLCSVADTILRKQILPIAVDTFEGTENEGEAHADAKTTDWEAKFKENVASFGLGNVTSLKMRTDEAHKNFIDGLFDLVFIDADHSAEAVANDIKLWTPKLKEGGILCGHDISWGSVREGLKNVGLEPVIDGNFWWLENYLIAWEL